MLMSASVLGIDPSLTSLGFAYYTKEGLPIVGTVKPKKVKGLARLLYLRTQVQAVLDVAKPQLIAYEGYAMGRFAGRAFDLGELGGVLKLFFFERKIPLLLVPPSSLKLFATGIGNADKQRVMAVMSKHRGRAFSSDDEADAYALLQVGIAFRDGRQRPRDPRHFKCTALRGCELVQAV
jgi:crossover junction endodeoxyribonuclease RuvC